MLYVMPVKARILEWKQKKIQRTNKLWSVQHKQLNTTRKSRDEVAVGCRHDNWSLWDAHERFNGIPETTIITQNNIHLQRKPRQFACIPWTAKSQLHLSL